LTNEDAGLTSRELSAVFALDEERLLAEWLVIACRVKEMCARPHLYPDDARLLLWAGLR
jgi:hypothetical protein